MQCRTPAEEYHLADIRGNGETGFCLGYVVQWFVSSHYNIINPELNADISLFFLPFRFELVEHLISSM